MDETLLRLLVEIGLDILVGKLLAGTDLTRIRRRKVGDSIVVHLQIHKFPLLTICYSISVSIFNLVN